MVRLVCWNTNHLKKPWYCLRDMDVDVALVQEACNVPDEVLADIDTGPRKHWDACTWNSCWWVGRFRRLTDRQTMIVKRRSSAVQVKWFKQVGPISGVNDDEIAVSGIGTIAAARVIPPNGEPFIAVSMYARWIKPHPKAAKKFKVGYPDGTAHRILSDLSAFIGDVDPSSHRLLLAGDFNMIYRSTDHDSQAINERCHGVFQRINDLGLELVGPQFPAGRRAEHKPTSYCEPPDSKNVPTYHTVKESPETATGQLDYVFASRGFHESVTARALNDIREWGPSDHCRILIEVGQES